MMATSNPHRTQGHVNKKATSTAADDLMQQVAQEKRIREERKKKRQEEKKAEEELLKTKREKATTQEDIAATAIISPLAENNVHGTTYDGLNLTNALFAMTIAELVQYGKEELGQTSAEAALYAARCLH
jgi:hypothetical protein